MPISATEIKTTLAHAHLDYVVDHYHNQESTDVPLGEFKIMWNQCFDIACQNLNVSGLLFQNLDETGFKLLLSSVAKATTTLLERTYHHQLGSEIKKSEKPLVRGNHSRLMVGNEAKYVATISYDSVRQVFLIEYWAYEKALTGDPRRDQTSL